MSTITREHLELAALAAGIKADKSKTSGGGSNNDGFDATGALVIDWHNGITWRPHTSPGDAARLADRLLMYVDARGTAVQARVADGPWHRVERNESANAWCEAVVKCAAAVGERMQKGGA